LIACVNSLGPDREIPEGHPLDSAIHIPQRVIQLQKVGATKFQFVLIRLINSSNLGLRLPPPKQPKALLMPTD
jgi:hypothetical protein